MHLQGREFIFENLNITVAYFSNEPDFEFDNKSPRWLGDDCPFEDNFNDFESFTSREGGGVLIVAVYDLTVDELKFVNDLISASKDDQIRLLICDGHKRYKATAFDALIRTTYDLVNSIYDLAFSVYTGFNIKEGVECAITRLSILVRQSKNGVLISHWDNRKNMNLITLLDLVDEWPFPISKAKNVVGLYTWLNPANFRWTKKSVDKFDEFAGGIPSQNSILNSKCRTLCFSGNYEPVVNSRNPAPDVIQLIMI
jgi:hypothetical protein